jgi:hypothetical protein
MSQIETPPQYIARFYNVKNFFEGFQGPPPRTLRHCLLWSDTRSKRLAQEGQALQGVGRRWNESKDSSPIFSYAANFREPAEQIL